ncbi:MAG: DUF839 domain-containing protein [Gammaproteobacteria bacterium]|nr:DUF839 domain-containing protein [Gammaproteobacteria bacterium]MDE0259753.1 DUF839 domain-containing protein [Gammaproteobacteria bacterium]
MTLGRRTFLSRLASAGGLAACAPSLAGLVACGSERRGEAVDPSSWIIEPYGPLVRSPDCPELEIAEHLHCVRLSSGGVPSPVREGFLVPNAFDGMAAFPMANGNVRLIRNHEMTDPPESARPIGSPAYDDAGSGGTTSLEVRITGEGEGLRAELVDEFASLAGTRVNCAGGPTPWGSWLSCEETTEGRGDGFQRPHGYIFEVPVDATGPVDPVPLTAMGRFVHEAVAVDPETGIVYETEDTWYVPLVPNRPGAGLYRFIPREPGVLAAGGRLQMMAVTGEPGYLTARNQTAGTVLPVHWVDIDDPDPEDAGRDELAVFRQGLAKGGARFARLEGAFHGDGGIYVVSTNGGDATSGQVFHYRPTSADQGELTLVFESPAPEVLDSPDNIVLSPRGGLVMCEDGSGEQHVRALDREGRIVNLARAPLGPEGGTAGEFAGSCFSPDGRVLFFNQQGGRRAGSTRSSATYAMWGPWEDGPV